MRSSRYMLISCRLACCILNLHTISIAAFILEAIRLLPWQRKFCWILVAASVPSNLRTSLVRARADRNLACSVSAALCISCLCSCALANVLLATCDRQAPCTSRACPFSLLARCSRCSCCSCIFDLWICHCLASERAAFPCSSSRFSFRLLLHRHADEIQQAACSSATSRSSRSCLFIVATRARSLRERC